jgi:intein-encoded DNA endonuclease-like protein
MVADLEKWGCVENKTFKLNFPDFISEELIPHFIRGYFDGDGSVFLHKQKVNNLEYQSLGV